MLNADEKVFQPKARNRRLVEEYLARPADETAEAPNEKPNEEKIKTDDLGPEEAESEEEDPGP